MLVDMTQVNKKNIFGGRKQRWFFVYLKVGLCVHTYTDSRNVPDFGSDYAIL